MDKVDIREFRLRPAPRPAAETLPSQAEGSSLNAFLGFGATKALAAVFGRLERLRKGARLPRPAADEFVPDRATQKPPHATPFGELPVVVGSLEVTFRN